MLDREILNRQIKELFRQLVSLKLLNLEFPVSGNTEPWAQFYFGHPDTCRENWAVPFVFLYGLNYNEDYQSNCSDKMEISMVIGLESKCEAIEAATNADNFENLWYKINRVFGRNSGSWTITGDISITNHDETVTTKTNPQFLDIGITKTLMGASSRLPVNIGEPNESLRYSATLTLSMYFKHLTPTFQ